MRIVEMLLNTVYLAYHKFLEDFSGFHNYEQAYSPCVTFLHIFYWGGQEGQELT